MRNFSPIGITIVIDWYSFFFFLTSALCFLPAGVRETEGFGAGIQDAELIAKLLCGLYFFFNFIFGCAGSSLLLPGTALQCGA